jgi:hypothetical protein
MVHAASEADAEQVVSMVRAVIHVGDAAPAETPVLIARVAR